MASKKKRSWNDMSHLSLKRFADDDDSLTPGAKRNRAAVKYDAVAEMDPSGRSRCKACGETLPKGVVRLVLQLQCHKGYKIPCTLHPSCFWDHIETKKLKTVDEIHFKNNVSDHEKERIHADFQLMAASNLERC